MNTTFSSLLLTMKNIIQKVAPYIPPICVIISNVSEKNSIPEPSAISELVNMEKNLSIRITISRYSELRRAEEALQHLAGMAELAARTAPSIPKPGEKATSTLVRLPINQPPI